MPNQKTHKQEKPVAKSRTRQRMMVTFSLLLSLMVGGSALAQWSGLWSAPQQSVKPAGGGGPTYHLAKEFVYANGKLVATEEPPTCDKSINLTYQSFPAAIGSGSVNVTTQPGCTWTAQSNATAWLNVTSGASGNGNGTVVFSVAANGTTDVRSGTLTVAGHTFTVYQGKPFNDAQPGDPFYSEIGRLVARGVTAGCSLDPPLYCPNNSVTREQMAAFIIKGLGEFTPPTPGSQRFLDVPPSSPFYNFIDRMAVLNITAGCGGGNYCPANPIPHEQMAVFIIKALGMTSPPMPTTQRFPDVPLSNPFAPFIEQMAERGIWRGQNDIPGLNYSPASAVTRREMAVMLVRAFNL
jgi:hypothetical protein